MDNILNFKVTLSDSEEEQELSSQERSLDEETVINSKSQEFQCRICKNTDFKNFTPKRKNLCKNCKNLDKVKSFFCKNCGETQPSKFYEGRYSACKKCRNRKSEDFQKKSLGKKLGIISSDSEILETSLDFTETLKNIETSENKVFLETLNVGFGSETPEQNYKVSRKTLFSEDSDISPESFKRNLHFYFSTDTSFLKGETFSDFFQKIYKNQMIILEKIKHFEEQMLDFKSDNDVIKHLTRNHEFISELLGTPNIYKKDK
jgi:hypothetical protein